MRVIAHRGCADRAPENTVAAVRRAAPHVDAVEVDVRRCGSGEVVVVHDATLDRVTGASGAVAETVLGTLDTLGVAGTDEPIPTLSALLAAVSQTVAVNVELKETGLAGDVVAAARECPNEVFVSSFLPEALREVRAVGGGAGSRDCGGEADPALPTALLFAADWDGAVATARDLDCAYLHPEHSLVTADRVSNAHDAGFAVNAWTVRTREAVARLRAAGVDGVVVDDWAVAGRGEDGGGAPDDAGGGDPGDPSDAQDP